MHSEAGITVTSAVSSSGGAISSDATLTNSAAITGNVESALITNTGSIVGFVTQPSRDKTVPGADIVAQYVARATDISYWSIPSGDIKDTILAKSTNPYGSQNAEGIYRIRVPAGYRLRIENSIIQATLLIEFGVGSQFVVRNLVAWEPPASGMPALLAHGAASASVSFAPDTGTVNVPLLGVNLLGIVIVIGTRATAPAELHGLFHVMGGAPTSFTSTPRLIGTYIGDGPITIAGSSQLIADPNIAANPPLGYTVIDSSVTAVPGSFRWEVR
jgi:hypothetical protein